MTSIDGGADQKAPATGVSQSKSRMVKRRGMGFLLMLLLQISQPLSLLLYFG